MAKKDSGTGFSLKDQLFNRERVTYLAELFANADDSFDKSVFVRQVMKTLTKLELKERIVHIASVLEQHLSKDFPAAASQITKALPPPLDPKLTDDDFGDFIFAPLGEFVVRNGMTKRHVKRSLRTLKALTMRFSMEDAIRSFINEHTENTMAELAKWATDANYHVRRLASEGTRPLLPWSPRIAIEAATPLPILDALHADPTRYVTRSVANHLNDIAKSNPATVVDTLKRWKKLKQQDTAELNWMTKHALRTLVKQGNPQALRLLGFRSDPKVTVSKFELRPDRVKPGEAIEFSFELTASRDEPLLVDYIIDFVKANGRTAPKVHKLKQLNLRKDVPETIRKRHLLKANATTYTLYPGTHRVTLQINGRTMNSLNFELLEPNE